MTYTLLLLLLAMILVDVMAGAWAIAERTGQSGWIDSIWSLSLGVVGVLAALLPVAGADTMSTRQMLVAAMVGLWALRLGLHIARRTHGGGDDPRYAKMKADWGDQARGKLFLFLQIQAFFAFLLMLSVLAAARNPAPELGWFDLAGALVLLLAVIGEGVADEQLNAFRADPANRGKVCDWGLWGRSRHPNYFFQWLGWLGYALIGLNGVETYPWGLVALSGPVIMYVLLVHLSGIPPLEAHMLRARGDAFRAYQARVNAFFPGPRR
ncbi:membrane protein [Azorhizobium oxalatiphilum]|uniref:Membrane protein n=1 Tax=Azorhizobium oxalatiphilum TaxID=980631 RepID=A0A917FA30_9HYPH|nr:DUF1295 domain-containing protein [Azorhizobium oxalatiphilum]GGF61161.1 membrane protein [Azorhizobium oxalatiphilum]